MLRKPALATFLALVAISALAGSASASVTNTRIVSGPSGTVATDSVTFAFTSPEDGGFQCRLDGGEWSGCSSPKTYEELADGPHSFEVRALNKAGHPDPTPSARSFTVELEPEPEPEPPVIVPPVPAAIAIDSGPPKPVAGQSFNVEPVDGTVELQCPGELRKQMLSCHGPAPQYCIEGDRAGMEWPANLEHHAQFRQRFEMQLARHADRELRCDAGQHTEIIA